MKLASLSPSFLRAPVVADGRNFIQFAPTLEEASGLAFNCPECEQHRIICWTPAVSQEHSPRPGRWALHGTGYNDLTLRGPPDSVHVQGGCQAHFFIREGRIVKC